MSVLYLSEIEFSDQEHVLIFLDERRCFGVFPGVLQIKLPSFIDKLPVLQCLVASVTQPLERNLGILASGDSASVGAAPLFADLLAPFDEFTSETFDTVSTRRTQPAVVVHHTALVLIAILPNVELELLGELERNIKLVSRRTLHATAARVHVRHKEEGEKAVGEFRANAVPHDFTEPHGEYAAAAVDCGDAAAVIERILEMSLVEEGVSFDVEGPCQRFIWVVMLPHEIFHGRVHTGVDHFKSYPLETGVRIIKLHSV